jgi:hypothetical protein
MNHLGGASNGGGKGKNLLAKNVNGSGASLLKFPSGFESAHGHSIASGHGQIVAIYQFSINQE